ncbi:unnamed protein product [Cylindrotheca closterium]|uniref:Uncharacterized protein n=1 Tax=Cylindrotheca closterium TaxID=2856 RepID=A0AAD2CFA4_9STRA|nr:unnamed protein product [Cylindrotheca closterium]
MTRHCSVIAALVSMLLAQKYVTVEGERVNVDFVPENLPSLDCLTYETVAEAKEACKGTFLMWGEYFEDVSRFQSKISLFQYGNESEMMEAANYGPYYCSGCSTNSSVDYGFIGGKESEQLPGTIFGFSVEEALPTTVYCGGGDVEVETVDDLSCGALQRYCEEQKLGWLTYASTFETATGVFTCSGGCAGSSLFAGQKIAPLPGNETDFLSWPMIVMWSMIALFLLASATLDYRLFDGKFFEWMKRYYLHMFGYINIKGERLKFCSVFKNPFECLCFICQRDERSSVLWFRFLSVTVLSFGVSILFGDASKHDHVCFFDSTQDTAYPLFSDMLDKSIWDDLYGQKDGPGLGDWPVVQFSIDWVLSELAILLFATSQEILIYNLIRGELMKDIAAAVFMLSFSFIFTICAYAYYLEEVHLENLYIMWLALLVVSYVIVPIFGANAYIFAALTVRCFGWKIPESDEERKSRTKIDHFDESFSKDPSRASKIKRNSTDRKSTASKRGSSA